MWSRRTFPVVAIFLIIALTLMQTRTKGKASELLHKYGPKRTSQLHLLVPASATNDRLCRTLLSSAILGYPPAVLAGWNGTGEFNAAITHLAKLRNIARYLDNLPPAADDDLVLTIDGYDVILQLPPEVLIERYFDVVKAANDRLAEQYGLGYSGSEVPNEDDSVRPRLEVIFGPDKLCWPEDGRRIGCWAAPNSGIPNLALLEGDEMTRNQPRWLNSGTMMGPVGAVRKVINATLERINNTYDPSYPSRESDQLYLSDLWGLQEYARTERERRMQDSAAATTQIQPHLPDTNAVAAPSGDANTEANDDRHVPMLFPALRYEYHMGLDYASALFQPRAGYEVIVEMCKYDGPDASTLVKRNVLAKPDFVPYEIRLPENVVAGVGRLLSPVADQVPNWDSTGTLQLLATRVPLGTNLVTKHVYTLFHCTGEKGYLDDLWRQLWFYPYARALFAARLETTTEDTPLSNNPIDGRIWKSASIHKTVVPRGPKRAPATTLDYGAWSGRDAEWLDWNGLCGAYEDRLFGDASPPA